MRQTVIPYFRLQFLLYQLCTNTRKCAHTGQCQVKSYFETGVCCQGCQHLETLKIANSVVSFVAFIRMDYLHSWELEKFGFSQNQGSHKKILDPHRFSQRVQICTKGARNVQPHLILNCLNKRFAVVGKTTDRINIDRQFKLFNNKFDEYFD